MIRLCIRLSLFVVIFFCQLSSTSAQDISNNTFGNGLNLVTKDSSMTLKFRLRFATLYEGVYEPETKQHYDNVMIRRFRLKFDGYALSPKLVYKVELGISNNDMAGVDDDGNGIAQIILDSYLKWNFAGNFVLWFGQAKLPGNRERVISSQKLQFVDRSLLNARFNLDRDLGFQLHHHHNIGKAVLREVLSVSQGEGRNIAVSDKSGFDYTGRLEYLPFGLFAAKGDYFESDLRREPTPKLSIAATYDYNVSAIRTRGQLGPWLDNSRNLYTWFVDAIYKHKGFSAMVEYCDRRTEGTAVVERDTNGEVTQAFYTGKAANGQLSYLFKNNFEIAGRGSLVNQDADTERLDIRQYTLGISKYIFGHSLKAQTDVSYTDYVGGIDEWMFRFQVEMGF